MKMNLETSIDNLGYLLYMTKQDNDDNGENANKDLEIFEGRYPARNQIKK